VKYGGCGGEWGLTAQRANFLKRKYGQNYYDFLLKLKNALDPNNILNRGNLEGWM
jgi:FAD/FMN-containing dehydrogenase